MSLEGWKAFFEIGGVILLFLSFVCGAGALYFSNRINAVQDAQLRQFDKDMTEAKTALGKQQERTAAADARVAGLEHDAADAKTEMAKQQERAAIAEKSLLELRERLKDRHLTAAKRTELVAFLTASPKGEITVSCVGGHPEPCVFAAELVDALKAGGWTVAGFAQGVVFIGSSPSGVLIQVKSAEHTPPRAIALQQSLTRIGLQAGGQLLEGLAENAVNLLVGTKP